MNHWQAQDGHRSECCQEMQGGGGGEDGGRRKEIIGKGARGQPPWGWRAFPGIFSLLCPLCSRHGFPQLVLACLPGVGSAGPGQRERGQGRVGSLAGLASLQGKLEKSLEHLQKQMEDALLFQAQAEETCALWQASSPALRSWGWGEGGH